MIRIQTELIEDVINNKDELIAYNLGKEVSEEFINLLKEISQLEKRFLNPLFIALDREEIL